MPNPTRQEIIDAQLARQWAEWSKSCEVSSPEIQAAANFILAHTTPPTMAEVEWDDDKHYLAEAEQNVHGQVIMLGLDADGLIEYFVPRFYAQRYDAARPDTITPTGRRFTLTEAQE